MRLSSTIEKRLLAAGVLVAALCVLLFYYVDRPAAVAARGLSPQIHELGKAITQLGNSAYSLIPFFLLFLFFRLAPARIPAFAPRRERWRELGQKFLFLFVAVAASGIANDILKIIFGRARPKMLFGDGLYGFSFFQFSARMNSFPSGHSDTAFALATALVLLLPRWRIPVFAIAVLVPISRVVVGAHYPSDVLAGAFLGVVTTLYLAAYFHRRGFCAFPARR
jgi:undecaprenyl-diphosphatase